MLIPQDKLNALSIETLRELNSAVVATIKQKVARESRLAIWKMEVGQRAHFIHTKTRERIAGTIVSIGQKNVVLRADPAPEKGRGSVRWTVTANLIKFGDKPEAIEGIPQF